MKGNSFGLAVAPPIIPCWRVLRESKARREYLWQEDWVMTKKISHKIEIRMIEAAFKIEVSEVGLKGSQTKRILQKIPMAAVIL